MFYTVVPPLLYTIVPPEVIFEDGFHGFHDPESHGQSGEGLILRRAGRAAVVSLQTVAGAPYGYIRQVFSTDPRDYLDPALQPGQRLWVHGEGPGVEGP